jgi:NADH dehydrogenase FAD-containing subunit
MSAETKLHFPQSSVTLIHSRDTLLSAEPLPAEYKAKALDLVHEAGVDVKLGNRVLSETPMTENNRQRILLTLSNGETLTCDKVIYTATQTGANTSFLPANILDNKGCILTRPTLQFPPQFPNSESHFAIGDIVSGPGIKRSGPAQQSGKIAATNIMKLLLADEDYSVHGEIVVPTDLATVQHGPVTMSLAVGTQAMTIRGGGVRWGKEIRDRAFGPDLGAKGTLDKLGLSQARKSVVEKLEDGAREVVRPVAVAVAANM